MKLCNHLHKIVKFGMCMSFLLVWSRWNKEIYAHEAIFYEVTWNINVISLKRFELMFVWNLRSYAPAKFYIQHGMYEYPSSHTCATTLATTCGVSLILSHTLCLNVLNWFYAWCICWILSITSNMSSCQQRGKDVARPSEPSWKRNKKTWRVP